MTVSSRGRIGSHVSRTEHVGATVQDAAALRAGMRLSGSHDFAFQSGGRCCRILVGVYPPDTTPFSGDGEVDLDALRLNIDRYISTPVAWIVALRTNGEAPLLSESDSDCAGEWRGEQPRELHR